MQQAEESSTLQVILSDAQFHFKFFVMSSSEKHPCKQAFQAKLIPRHGLIIGMTAEGNCTSLDWHVYVSQLSKLIQ